ncbi:LLM class flavin-dependent oxidoreductase [Moraxella bovis]|uniref:LLM class flavin-dependent oxidoreductase n=1 Tax=Moraxella bovis TaxID=476 RepID=UPI002467DF91|nr:LLM class flavin-dependent oxidoreductase [Moraxella bovis]
MRVGSGGVMLPNHSPFVVAEQYGTLASLYPDRVDLGLGRAPGTDPATARAIRRHQDEFAMSFPSDIKELQFYFGNDDSDKVRAYPAKGLNVPLYILGSSPESAYLAAELGLPYAFASHFAPRFLVQAVEIYRREFKPSDVLDKPKVIVGLNAIVADTDSEAKLLSTTSLQFLLNVVTGERSGMKPPTSDIESRIPPHTLSMAKSMTACSVIGSPQTVKAQLEQLQSRVNADEFMAVSYIYDKDKQARSYELLADVVKG